MMRAGRLVPLLALVASVGCSGPARIDLTYDLHKLPLDEVLRIQTLIDVDAADPRQFYGDKDPFRYVAHGVYVVIDDFGTGRLQMLLKQDTSFGFVVEPTFTFTLLGPTEGEPAPLTLDAVAIGRDGEPLADSGPVSARFGGPGVTLSLDACGGVLCAASQACCGATCVILGSDPASCGGCGRACGADEICVQGNCRCEDGPSCASGSACCLQVGCIDLQSDPFHCGTCDKQCNLGETCSAGSCVCGTNPACASGVTCCDGTCDTTMAGCVCGAGHCLSTAGMDDQICCPDSAGTCVAPYADAANCGACGKQCKPGLSCAGGECTCKGTVCDATCCTSGCAELDSDPLNCSTCGRVCAPGATCTNGNCTCGGTTCAGADDLCCADACTPQSVLSCGSCTKTCKTGESCAAGQCQCNGAAPCIGSQTCCMDGCFDLTSDPKHCGSCTNVCAVGQSCMASQCVAGSGPMVDANGNSCTGTSCACGTGAPCAGANFCCGGACTARSSDAANCGTCGNLCSSGGICCGIGVSWMCQGGGCVCGDGSSNGVVCDPTMQRCCPNSGTNGACIVKGSNCPPIL